MAASTSTAAHSNNNSCYDVFISHRGPDVKKTFASHMYHRLIAYGLRVFLDYQELQEGAEFPCQIKGAIRTASVQIAIFSPTYADSQWCLDELVLMLETRAPIIPVFYHVKPTELRRTQGEGVYATSLRNLQMKRKYDSEPRYDSKTIENWRNALSRVADISGFDLDEGFNGDEGELLDQLVKVVLKKGIKKLNVARYPTGLKEKVEDFETKLSLQGFVGITGLGGVGKTTLAKELFNKKSSRYSKSCFLSDVRERAKISIPSLQRELLKDLSASKKRIKSKDEGLEILRKHFSVLSDPVLLVLDDVDHQDQVHALLPVTDKGIFPLPPSSLILITTRDKNVLIRSGVQEPSIYKLTGHNTERSRELFCSHAFSQPHPMPGFEDLVNQFLEACNGLPLSLKVFGGLLYGNTNKSYWKDELEELRKALPYEIQKRLQISYDALPREEQQIFLDIACFFIGESRDTAIRVWDGSGWNGSRGFESLLNKCLVEVDNGKKIRMHDHLRDLGRDLSKNLKWPRRIWSGPGNINDLLQQLSGVTDVRGIRMLRTEYRDEDEQHPSFSSYATSKLQLLHIDIESDLTGLHAPNLIWFRWQNCLCSSLPPCISMKKLRVLQVQGTKLETLWPDELQPPLQLRELQIVAPLSKIPKSIMKLNHLERIVVTCPLSVRAKFEHFPEEFCHLPSLKHLEFKQFSRLRSLPDSFGNLKNLEHIDLTGCSNLKRLPNSFGRLINLKYLDLSYCYDLSLSEGSFGNISRLGYIGFTYCYEIEVLPSQIAHQRSLELLHLNLPNLKEWPSAPGEPSGLEKVVLQTPCLETLPSSIGRDLKNLTYLEMRGCRSLKRLPDSVRLLNHLTKWIVKDCALPELTFKMVEGASDMLTGSGGELLQLRYLELHNTEISEISFATGVCPNLQHLDIRECKDLEEVGTLPNALIKLVLYKCSKLRKIRDFCGLSKLQMLKISHCEEVPGLPSIEKLISLEELQVLQCTKLKIIRGLAQLIKLQEIDVSNCNELEEMHVAEGLRSLKKFQASGCRKLKIIRGLELLTALRQLDVSYCYELEELPGVEHLRSLEMLRACYLPLRRIQGLEMLTALRQLDVSGCYNLQDLLGIGHLRSLEMLRACDCLTLKSILGLAQLTKLTELNVSGCLFLEELPGVEHSISLEKLLAHDCVRLKGMQYQATTDLLGIGHLRSLEMLRACDCRNLKSILGLAELTKLTKLNVSGCRFLEQLPGVEHSISLEKLLAHDCVRLKGMQYLATTVKFEGSADMRLPFSRLFNRICDCCGHWNNIPTVDMMGQMRLSSSRLFNRVCNCCGHCNNIPTVVIIRQDQAHVIQDEDGRQNLQQLRGVQRRRRRSWVSEIRLPKSRRKIWLGSYSTAEQAARAYDAAVYCLRGPNSKFNFPNSVPDIPSAFSLSWRQIQIVAAKIARHELPESTPFE